MDRSKGSSTKYKAAAMLADMTPVIGRSVWACR